MTSQSSRWINSGITFLRYFHYKLIHDRLLLNAGSLSYTTLLSLVPLLGVMVAIFSAFPAFEQISGRIEGFIFENFVPAAGEQIQTALEDFVHNTKQMTALGVLFLVVVAMLLMAAVDKAIDDIWGNLHRRRLTTAFMLYWSILTLGPLLVGAGLVVSSFLMTAAENSLLAGLGIESLLLKLLPYITSILAFFLLYTLVPGKPVRFLHAITGALVASLLFEMSKKIFVLYITGFSSYEALYGALAAVPILFVWVYIAWLVVLLGAEVTYCLGHFHKDIKEQR